MKVHDILNIHRPLNEAINVSHYDDELSDAFFEGLRKGIEKFLRNYQTFKESFDAETLKKIFSQGEMSRIFTQMRPQLEKIWTGTDGTIEAALKRVVDQIVDAVNKTKESDSYVHFIEGMKPKGTASHGEIQLNKDRFLDPLLKSTIDYLYEYALNTIDDDMDFFVAVKRALERAVDNIDELRSDVKLANGMVYDDMIDTLVHEIVHVIQFSRITGKDTRYDYRSYLQPDKEKFYQAIRSMDDDKHYKLHAASPQEITAHAHNVVLDIVKDYDLRHHDYSEPPPKIDAKTIQSYADHYLHHFDPNNRIEQKIRNRYYRLIFQELNSVIANFKQKYDQRRARDEELS